MLKVIKVIFGIVVFSFFVASAVYAFKTLYWVGGTIHEEIYTGVLMSEGISEESFQVIDDGSTSQDNPATSHDGITPKLFVPRRHFDDNTIAESFKFIDERYQYIKERAAKAYENKQAYRDVLYAFGELLHTIEDLYAHTNYVELYLKNKRVEPQAVPIVEMENLPPGLKSGYFYFNFDEPAENEATLSYTRDVLCVKVRLANPGILPLLEGDEFKNRCNGFAGYISYATDPTISVLHLDINKDSPTTYAGSMVVPGIGKTLYQYAYNLAVRETRRQWDYLQELIRETYPEDADKIIQALKTGIMAEQGQACEGMKKPQAELSGLEKEASGMDTNLTSIQDYRSQATKVETDLLKLITELEGLKKGTSALSYDCANALSASQGPQQIKTFLSDTGSKVTELRKRAESFAVMVCAFAEEAKQATDAGKLSKYARDADNIAKKAKESANEAKTLFENAKLSFEQFMPMRMDKEANELSNSLEATLAKLKALSSSCGNLPTLQFKAQLAYSSLDALLRKSAKVNAVIQELLKPCPKDAFSQHIINATEKLCGLIGDTNKQAKVHLAELESIVERNPVQLARAEDLGILISKEIEACKEKIKDKVGTSDSEDVKASLDTIKLFAQAAEDSAAKAENCALAVSQIAKQAEQKQPAAKSGPVWVLDKVTDDPNGRQGQGIGGYNTWTSITRSSASGGGPEGRWKYTITVQGEPPQELSPGVKFDITMTVTASSGDKSVGLAQGGGIDASGIDIEWEPKGQGGTGTAGQGWANDKFWSVPTSTGTAHCSVTKESFASAGNKVWFSPFIGGVGPMAIYEYKKKESSQ